MLLPVLLGETQGFGGQKALQQGSTAEAPEPKAGPAGPPAGQFKKTMIGIAPGAIRDLDHQPIGIVPSPERTLVPSPAGQENTSPAKPAPAPFQTMLGMAPALPTKTPTDEKEDMSPMRPASAPFQTMLGMAPTLPTKAPINEAKQTLLGAGSISEPKVKALLPAGSKKETLIGVAIPGIAPINPGINKSREEVPVENEPQVFDTVDEPLTAALNAAHPAAQRTRRYLGLSLAITAGILAAISAVAIAWWRSTPRLVVQVRTDESGRDSLELDCQNCNDGSEIALDESSTSFKGHHASIPLKTPLKMGDNSVQLLLSRQRARSEKIQLSVPVEYRVTGDTSGLDETPPKLRLLFEKLPNVTVEVGGHAITFDPSGHGHFDIDVTNDLLGPSSVERPLERHVTYQVRSTSGATEGAVNIRTGILPLVVDSPGPLLVTDREEFKLCGTSTPNVRIDVAGLGIGVDGSGHFCHAMIIKEVGKFAIWITANAKGFAPRKIQRVIERSSNLSAYAKKLYGEVPHEFEKSTTLASESGNALFAISGTIIELSESPPITRMLLQLGTRRDAQGFVRVVASNQPALPAGHMVTVFGQVSGTLKGPDGRDMRELSAAFIVPGVP